MSRSSSDTTCSWLPGAPWRPQHDWGVAFPEIKTSIFFHGGFGEVGSTKKQDLWNEEILDYYQSIDIDGKIIFTDDTQGQMC